MKLQDLPIFEGIGALALDLYGVTAETSLWPTVLFNM